MKTIKKIGILPFVKMHTAFGALIGLVLGILYSFGGLVIDTLVTIGWITSQETPGLSSGTVLAFGALIGMPIIFAVFGCVVGLVGAPFYNLFAKWFGGIKIDVE